jgi:AraC-like DNA-binding protein
MINKDHTPTIAISYSRMIARQLGLAEKELWRLLVGTGLSVEELLNDDTLIFRQQLLQIIANAYDISGDAAFGLKLGQTLTPPSHGPIGFVANSSPNLGVAIRNFQTFLPTRISFTHLNIQHQDGWLCCRFDIDMDGEERLYRCVLECFVLSLLSLVEFILGRPFTEGQVFCRYPAPDYAQMYQETLPCPVFFSADESKLLIPEALENTANASSDHVNYEFALRQCQRRLTELENDGENTTKRVRKLLLSHPPGQLNEDAAANLLFISKRTMARRLEQENSSFLQLRDETLSSLAKDYLRDTRLSVDAIAGLLNYHDSSSFRRAFKRWQQITPQDYRKNPIR